MPPIVTICRRSVEIQDKILTWRREVETKPHSQQRCFWWLVAAGSGKVHFLPWCGPGRSQNHTSEITWSAQIVLYESEKKDEKGGLWSGKGILWPKYAVGSSQRTNKNEKIKREKERKEESGVRRGWLWKVARKTRRRGHGAETKKG